MSRMVMTAFGRPGAGGGGGAQVHANVGWAINTARAEHSTYTKVRIGLPLYPDLLRPNRPRRVLRRRKRARLGESHVLANLFFDAGLDGSLLTSRHELLLSEVFLEAQNRVLLAPLLDQGLRHVARVV